MADVHSAGRKPQMYKDPETGKMKVRMVPSKQDVKSEKTLTPAEKRGRERIAKKLPMKDFKKRYGDDAMAVKMATATKIAKKKYESDSETSGMDETKAAPKGYHFTKSGQLKKGDADVDGPGGKKLRADPLDKQRSKIPPLPEAVTYHGNPNKDDDARNAARRRALVRQDNLLRKRKAEKEKPVEENFNWKVSHAGKDVHVKAPHAGAAVKKAQKGFGNMDLTKAKITNLGKVGMPAKEEVEEVFSGHYSMPSKRQIGRASDEPNYSPAKMNRRPSMSAKSLNKKLYGKAMGSSLKPEYEATDKPPFEGPYKKKDEPTKDQYGNVVKKKNVAYFLAKKGMKKAMGEAQVDEISTDLKKRYVDKAKSDYGHQQYSRDIARQMGADKETQKHYTRKMQKRMGGIGRATATMGESVEEAVNSNDYAALEKKHDELSAYHSKEAKRHHDASENNSDDHAAARKMHNNAAKHHEAASMMARAAKDVTGDPKMPSHKVTATKTDYVNTANRAHRNSQRARDAAAVADKSRNESVNWEEVIAFHENAIQEVSRPKYSNKRGQKIPGEYDAAKKQGSHYFGIVGGQPKSVEARKRALNRQGTLSTGMKDVTHTLKARAMDLHHRSEKMFGNRNQEGKDLAAAHRKAKKSAHAAKQAIEKHGKGSSEAKAAMSKYNDHYNETKKRYAAYNKSRGYSESVEEAKSFDQKFKDHLKFATSKSKSVQDYMKKKVADRDAMNKANDPNAARKGYALSAVPPERAYMKARKKGMDPYKARQAASSATRSLGGTKYRGRKLPEETQLDEMKANAAYTKAAKDIKAYAAKNGGIDKKDMMNFAADLDLMGRAPNILQAGRILDRINTRFKGYDTDVRDRLSMYLKKHGLME